MESLLQVFQFTKGAIHLSIALLLSHEDPATPDHFIQAAHDIHQSRFFLCTEQIQRPVTPFYPLANDQPC